MAVPALIVSGFLGSGKTTLVRELLAAAQRDGIRVAIISNELGDTGIDRALLESGTDGLVELDGGCVCCKLSDALGETLEMLLTEVRPDRLILETSGVGLPGEVVVQFWRPPIDTLVSDEVVVVCVDGTTVAALEDDATFLNQVESADLLLLTKADRLTPDAIAEATARLEAIVGDRPVIPCAWGRVSPDLLFPPDPEGFRQTRRDPAAEMHPHTHDAFATVEWTAPDGVTDEELVAHVAAHGALRAKGFVRTVDGVRLLQGVGARIEIGPPPVDPPAELIGTVVLITRA